MGEMQRRKGQVGVSEFKKILTQRGYTFDCISCGIKAEDLIVDVPGNGRYSCEVKYHEIIDIKRYLKQAQEQARQRGLPWMLAVRIPRFPKTWLVFFANRRPALWEPLVGSDSHS